jgi:hypothetical protein
VGPRSVLDAVVKRKIPSPRRESNPRTLIVQSPPSGAEVKNTWSYTSAPPIRLHGVVLSQAQGNFSGEK